MDNINDNETKYHNVLNRIQKKICSYEPFILVKKQYMTDNTLYYFLCVLLRFIYLIGFCGDYIGLSRRRNNVSFRKYLYMLTCYNFLSQINISFITYIAIILIILILFIIRLFLNYKILKSFSDNKSKQSKDYDLPNKYQIILDHIVFLFFPYIIEYLSFIYYIFFLGNNFIIKLTNIKVQIIFIIIIINTILIIVHNLENYVNIFCSNRTFTITIFDAYSYIKLKRETKKKPVKYKCSNIVLYIFIFYQNFLIILPLQNYINIRYTLVFKIVLSLILVLSIILYLFCEINTFNYSNLVNASINVLIIFCFYSIIFDLFIVIGRYRLLNEINEIIFVLTKLFFAYITYRLLKMKSESFLKSKIIEILFQEKNKKKENHFVNSFYYLHQIMLKIKQINNVESAFLLIKFLNKHIDKCHKLICNCKIFGLFTKNQFNKKYSDDELKNYILELINILNYLFESSFIDYDYYKSYDLVILLAEHFCHLKNNPIMSFSLITTFMMKQKNKFNKLQLITLYELCQKYIYYITANTKYYLDEVSMNNKVELLLNKERSEILRESYINLKTSHIIKKYINNYINNEIKILKYKYIFEDSLTIQYDENNENIISIKNNFFNQRVKIDNLDSDNKKEKKLSKKKKDKTNLYNVITLLNKEQFYYEKLLSSANKIELMDAIPIFMIFKYFLFFDIIDGGKMPAGIGNKLYNCLTNKTSLYNGIIRNSEYKILQRRYNEENNRINSKLYTVFEFKKELRTKFFTEDAALKLGYKQKDILNERIDVLMPREFFKSHQNAIKQLFIGKQMKYYKSKGTYYFDKTNTVLYSATFEFSMVYNLSKCLMVIVGSIFNFENEYSFMLDNNFELLAISRNFEDEYYLNQRLLKAYDIGIMDIVNIKQEKLYNYFKNEFNQIQYKKFMRQIKTEEYFLPLFYSPPGDKTASLMNSNHFNSSKNNFLSKFINIKNNEDDLENINNIQEDYEENSKLLKKEISKNSISELLTEPVDVVFHQTYSKIINKGNFIENIARELTKIPDNDLMLENDKISYNLIMSSKKLISKLLTKNELSNDFIKTTIRFSYYYDRPFYFITIEDEKKSFLKISKGIHFQNRHKNHNIFLTTKTSSIKTKNSIPYNKNDIKSRNKGKSSKNNSITNKQSFKKMEKEKEKSNREILINEKNKIYEKNRALEKIDEIRKKINKDRFITIIRWSLSIFIVLILVIYFAIIFFQRRILNISKKILFSYYYNSHTRDVFLYTHSKLLQIYYDYVGLARNSIEIQKDYKNILLNLYQLLQNNYYSFYDYFLMCNMDVGHNSNLINKKRNFKKIRGFWEEMHYECDYSTEIRFIIYNIYSVNFNKKDSEPFIQDLNNFIFFHNRTETREKINTVFIKLLYYLSSNYEFVYKELFAEIEDGIYQLYKEYINIENIFYLVLEIIGLLIYLIIFIVLNFYLYNSNEIIIKNILFLFMDFNDNANNNRNNNNKINLKLLEFKKLIDDFDLDGFERYSKNLDNINKNKPIILSDKNFNNNLRENDEKAEQSNDIINNTGRTSTSSKSNNKDKIKLNSLRKKEEKEKILKQIIGTTDKNNYLDSRNKKGMNNSSSHNYLMDSNSQFFKDQLNSYSINASNEILTKNNSTNINHATKHNIGDKDQKKEENENQENYQDLILNKSNKTTVFMITYFRITIFILILFILIYNIYKIYYTIDFNLKFNKYFSDFTIITNRYSILYYFFNTIRTLLIFPKDERKEKLEFIMKAFDSYYEEENNKFISVLNSNMGTYKKIQEYFNIIMESKNNSTEIIKEKICPDRPQCSSYLSSDKNVFDSGVDLAFKTCINYVKNIFLDYSNLKNNTDINEINSTLIHTEGSEFLLIGLSLSNMFLYVKEDIFTFFEIDVDDFNNTFNKKMSLLNVFSIILAIILFLFVVVFMFLYIWGYTKPIKEACYRINCSFYHIKTYNLTRYRKAESIYNNI